MLYDDENINYWLFSSGLNFDESQEAYDFQFAKWMTKEKVIAAVVMVPFCFSVHCSLF